MISAAELESEADRVQAGIERHTQKLATVTDPKFVKVYQQIIAEYTFRKEMILASVKSAPCPIEFLPLIGQRVILDNKLLDMTLMQHWLETERPTVNGHTPTQAVYWLIGWTASDYNEMRDKLDRARHFIGVVKSYGYKGC
jgi:hypothetical protein